MPNKDAMKEPTLKDFQRDREIAAAEVAAILIQFEEKYGVSVESVILTGKGSGKTNGVRLGVSI